MSAPGENEQTRFLRLEDREARRPAPEAREAFTTCYPRIRGFPASPKRPVVLALAVDARGSVLDCVPVEPGQALIIGRHSKCGLWLEEESISLRQLAVLVAAGQDGEPVTRLWDLNTGQPFTTEDGESSAAVVAEGVLYVVVGSYALLFVPARVSWPSTAKEGWDTLPRRRFIDQRGPKQEPARPRKRLRPDGEEFQTQITHVNALALLDDSEDAEEPVAELKLARGPKRVSIRVSARRLTEGVLLGRYNRCGIHLDFDRISRVHLLLVQVGKDVWALDTASTNGISRDEKSFRAASLRNGDQVWLANEVCVGWRRL